MSYISPRSLQLLQDIVSEDTNQEEFEDLYVEHQDTTADVSRRVENMNESEGQDFTQTLNFFEKLERENGVNGNVFVNGYVNGHVENGVGEDTHQGIAEESEEESFTVTEVSETTADTSNLSNDTGSNKVFKKTKRHSKKVISQHRDYNHNNKPGKASSVQDNSTDRDSVSDQGETMSDSGPIGRRQRKLNKRAQIQAFRPLGFEPLETAEERLEKKYEELEHLLSGQFVEQKRALRLNHVQQMELLRQQYAIASHGLPPTGVLVPRSMPAEYRNSKQNRQTGGDKENMQHPASEDDAYTTIRTLQATKPVPRRSRARSARTRPLSATRPNQSRSTSRDRRDRTPEKERRQQSGDRSKEHGRRRTKSRSRSNSRSRSSSESPRRMFVPTDTHLKNTENELVREWVKKKDIEFRRKKAEERKKKRLERKELIEKQIEREERFKDSKKIVRNWIKQKQREAYHKQKHEKDELKQEAARNARERAKKVSAVHGWGVDRPMSAPAPVKTERSKIRVSRPGTTVEEMQAREEQRAREVTFENGDDLGQQEVPQPPVTKYVYRRPVLGKVRLRMKQQQTQAESRPAPVKKAIEKPLTKEEIERRQRISYDEWLQQKRKEDEEKKKEMQRQKELAESELEFKRPVPDLVQNGKGNVLKGKGIPGVPAKGIGKPQYVSRVISQEERDRIREMARQKKHQVQRSLEEEVDTSYDERFESHENAIQRVAKDVVSYVIRSLSDEDVEEDLFEDDDEAEHEGLANLGVFGSKASLTSKTRPMSASAVHALGPKTSKSPRRPVSAQPKAKPVSREAVHGALPFPPEIGAPPHVQRIQKKLFNDRMWVNPEGGERPEPQGSDSNEHRVVMEMEDNHPQDHPTEDGESCRESLLSSKKRVSFCDETTVFDEEEESEVDEDLDGFGDDDPGQDASDLEKIRKLFLETDNAEDNVPSNGFFITSESVVQTSELES